MVLISNSGALHTKARPNTSPTKPLPVKGSSTTMVDGFAITTSTLEIAWKINRLRIAVKSARKDWGRYCDGLQAVASVGTSSPADESVFD